MATRRLHEPEDDALEQTQVSVQRPRAPMPRSAGASSPDEDKTEFLARRPTSTANASPRANGRAVPLDPSPRARPVAAAPAPKAVERTDALSVEDVVDPLQPNTQPKITRFRPPTESIHRPLPARADEDPPSKVSTPSTKRPNPFRREPTVPQQQVAPLPSSEAGSDGTLVVEVIAGATVFLDGAEQGVGPRVTILGVDRYQRHAVRIHADGYLPWSGTVCLEGRVAAKIKPSLRPRA